MKSSTDSRIVICEVKDTLNLKLLNTTDDLNKYSKARESAGDFLETQTVKKLPARQDILVRSLGQKDSLEKEMATRSSILAWKIPWTEEAGWLQSMRSYRREHNRTYTRLYISSKHPLRAADLVASVVSDTLRPYGW